MKILNPKTEEFEHLDAQSREIMKKTIQFFENKGKERLKEDYNAKIWYADFIDFVKKEKIFYKLLTPSQYGEEGCRWDSARNCNFNEILGFYGLPYWYTWQVTILGLGPIWMGNNESVKKKTAKLLEQGEIFAFGLSEKEHGADLYSSQMTLTQLSEGSYVADGGKYYIGNANQAGLVSVFAKDSDTDEYVFFTADPKHENYDLVKNVVSSQSYVAEFALNGYPVTDADILSRGEHAWDCALNTINVGKYNLGWASIGICSHAFFEAINHASKRNLYGKFVTDFPHVQSLMTDAFARLTAMKLFAKRNADYMRRASKDDRRYLLYNPLTKMKVTTQGEEVINLMWDVIAAKGFEKDTYFEMAAIDIRALPKLEGTVHVNMALIVKFMANYLFAPAELPDIPIVNEPVNDDFLFNQGATKGLGKTLFHDFNRAYENFDLPNITIFKSQIAIFKEMLINASPEKEQTKDIDFLLIVGELFATIAYGQLILENAVLRGVEDDILDQIFDFMIRDFSKYALQLYSKTSSNQKQMEYALKMIKKPQVNQARFKRVWENHVLSLKDTYEMNK
ncbi:MAG: acyl-CoA dehydrogenase [Desulfamplus sp.]|nr:acyl-CoA dehydrogenase [Desulfamplus sp.]MBF0389069.1 acyl-CoA dehydrogenase [Desulfamplus sp.]